MRRYVGTVVYRHILQVHLAPDHLPILFWKHAKVFSCFMLLSRVFYKRLPLEDIKSRPKFIVLPDGSLHNFVFLDCKWGIQSIHGFEDFYHEFLQIVNLYAIVSISGKQCFK